MIPIKLFCRSSMDFPEIEPSSFYGKRRHEVIRDIPSESEDSELSDGENEGKFQFLL